MFLLQRKVAQEKEKLEGPAASKPAGGQRAPASSDVAAASSKQRSYGDDIGDDGKAGDRADFKDDEDV